MKRRPSRFWKCTTIAGTWRWRPARIELHREYRTSWQAMDRRPVRPWRCHLVVTNRPGLGSWQHAFLLSGIAPRLSAAYSHKLAAAMDHPELLRFLESVRAGRTTPSEGVERLKNLPFEDLGFAKIDHHRGLRLGYPEVIFARGKTPAQVAGIVQGMLRAKSMHNILITRASESTLDAVAKLTRRSLRRASAIQFFPLSGTI